MTSHFSLATRSSRTLARDAGVSKQLFSEVLSGRKKVGALAARRMAKIGKVERNV